MKVVENTPERLVLEHRPYLLGGFTWFMGMVAFVTGVLGLETEGWERLFITLLGVGVMVAAAVFFPFVRITLYRKAQLVERRRAHIDKARVLTIPFADLSRVRQEANWSDGARLTRLVLELKDGRLVPLETGYSSRDLDPIETEVMSWLTEPAKP